MDEVKTGKQLYEGKAKQVFETGDENVYVVHFKDDATAFNGKKKAQINGKGAFNNAISSYIFKELTKQGIPNHFIRQINDTDMLVKKVKIVPVEVIVRNIAAGSLSARLGIPEKTPLDPTVLEYCYKNDELNDPLINDYHVFAMKLATPEQLKTIADMALCINGLLQAIFKKAGLIIADFKLEFGVDKDGEVILADEISPDTCRLWDEKTLEKLDKDRFRRDLGGVEDAYAEVTRRLIG